MQGRARRVATSVAAIGWLAVAPSVQAQDVRVTAPAAASDNALEPLNPDESDTLARALVFDPADLSNDKPAPALKYRSLAKSAKLEVKGTDKPDGSNSVAVKQAVPVESPDIDSSVGADLNLAAAPSVFQAGKPLPGMIVDRGGAAAWASFGMSNFASVDARLDPTGDQGKIGGKLSHSVPVGRDLSVTLEDSYSVTERLGGPAPVPAAPSPMTPLPATAASTASGQVFDTSKSIKFKVAPTGTTFGAGWSTASNDPVTHNTLSADQKLLGPLHVTTAVTDVGQPTASKSITAGFKLSW